MLPVLCRKAAWLPTGASALPKRLPLATRPAPSPGICALVNVHGESVGLYLKAPGSFLTSGDSKSASGTAAAATAVSTTWNGVLTGTGARFGLANVRVKL